MLSVGSCDNMRFHAILIKIREWNKSKLESQKLVKTEK